MPSRSTMAPCRLSNILTTTQDLHPGTAAFTMRWPTCCGASRQEWWHTRPSSTFRVMFVPNVHKVLTNLYHGWGKAFNRGFLSLMYQGEPAYMFDTTEHGSQSAQDPCQLDANSRALQLYQWVHLMYCLDTAVQNLHQLPVCINIMYQQRFTNCNSSQLSVLVFQGSSAVVSSAVVSMAANVAEVAVLMAATLSLIC